MLWSASTFMPSTSPAVFGIGLWNRASLRPSGVQVVCWPEDLLKSNPEDPIELEESPSEVVKDRR